MIPALPKIFEEFCDYLDGKLKWSEKKTGFTNLIFDFFPKLKEENLTEEREYMGIDYILRQKIPKYSTNEIELAVEHEISYRKPKNIIKSEVQHLVDIKAKYKIGIFYPSVGDVGEFKKEIFETLKSASYLSVPWEEYLFIFGFPTTKDGIRSILFKAFHLTWERIYDYQNLKAEELKDRIIKQKIKEG